MPGQHPNAVKEARSKAAIAVAGEMKQEFCRSMLGSWHEVLFEEQVGDYFTGHTPNYVKVYAPGAELHNQIRTVTVRELYQDGVLAEVLPE